MKKNASGSVRFYKKPFLICGKIGTSGVSRQQACYLINALNLYQHPPPSAVHGGRFNGISAPP